MITIEGFEATNYIEYGKRFRKVFTEKDYIKERYKGIDYYKIDPKKAGYPITKTVTDNPARDVHKVNALPIVYQRYYYLDQKQFIEYMLGNYEYSIYFCAYISAYIYAEHDDFIVNNTILFENVVIPNEEIRTIQLISKFIKLPDILANTLRFFKSDDLLDPKLIDFSYRHMTQYEIFRMRSHYIENKHVIDNLAIQAFMDKQNLKRLEKLEFKAIRERVKMKKETNQYKYCI